MNVFLTGCDKNTEWQLPWFIENYAKHCQLPLVIADFGMSESMLSDVSGFADQIIPCPKTGWFAKINALIECTKDQYDKVCWVDTDCQILADPSTIFRYTEQGKLTMVEDHPWTARRPGLGTWYNSGVIAVEDSPAVLRSWLQEANAGNYRGDQEALHGFIGGDQIKRITTIAEAPHKYNVLRLDILDKRVPQNPVIMHWTGEKGNLEIRKQLES